MSVHRGDPPAPKCLNSLAALSTALDEAALPEALPAVVMPVFREAPAFPPRVPRRPRGGGSREWFMIGLAFAGGLWVLVCGVLALNASATSPVYAEMQPAMAEVAVQEQLLDPVAAGRGGRQPQMVDGRPELAGKCAPATVSFVDNLAEATQQAKEKHKLLMILNVSGDFDDSRFT